MLLKMLEILLTMNFIWCWLLVFPVSVGMQWNFATDQIKNFSHKILQGCSTFTRISPKINLDAFFKNHTALPHRNQNKFFLVGRLTSKIYDADNGCVPTAYDTFASYKKCGVKSLTELLPSLVEGRQSWMKDVEYEVSQRGSLNFVFDGGTAFRYPPKKLPNLWFRKYTISAWISTKPSIGRQFILSWSNGDTPQHQNMGFFVEKPSSSASLTFGFFHTNENLQSNNKLCTIRKQWKINDGKLDPNWKFVSLSLDGCSVKLSVSGQELADSTNLTRVHTPERHLQPKFVVGARWAGSVTKYADYFHGRVSGLMLLAQEILDKTALTCVLECKERISLGSSLPTNIVQITTSNQLFDGSLRLMGPGNKKQWSDVISDLLYTNNKEYNPPSTNNIRSVTITLQDQKDSSNMVTTDVPIIIHRTPPIISFSGTYDTDLKKAQNIRLCPNMKITIKGACGPQTIDSMVVKTLNESFDKNQRLFISNAYLTRYGVKINTNVQGFTVYGIASVDSYTHLLRNIRFSFNPGYPVKEKLYISITVSSRNGLVKSEILKIALLSSEMKLPFKSLFSYKSHEKQNETTFMDISNQNEPTFMYISHQFMASFSNLFTISQLKFQITVFLVVICVGLLIFLLVLFSWGRCKKNSSIHQYKPYSETVLPSETSQYTWDDENFTTCLKINPTERVSISNDPFLDLLSTKNNSLSDVKNNGGDLDTSTDGSICSDDEEIEAEMTDFDNDSIRQLEWHCLEESLNRMLDGDDERCSSALESRTSELISDDLFF